MDSSPLAMKMKELMVFAVMTLVVQGAYWDRSHSFLLYVGPGGMGMPLTCKIASFEKLWTKFLFPSAKFRKNYDNLESSGEPPIIHDTRPKIRRADPLMTMTRRVGRIGTVVCGDC